MTGALAALGAGRPEVMSLPDIATLSSTSPRSFVIGGTTPIIALDGDLEHLMSATDGGGTTDLTWLSNGSPAGWECRATALVGTVTTGTMNAWLPLDSVQTWTRTGAAACSITLEVGRAGLNTAVDSCVVTF